MWPYKKRRHVAGLASCYMRLKMWTVNDLTSVFCSKSLHVRMVTLLCMPEACPCFVQTNIQSMLCLPSGTKRGSTVVYACSQVHTLRKARMYTIHGIHSLRRTIHGLCRSMLCARYNPSCAGQSTDCPDPYFVHNTYTYLSLR